MVADKQKNLDRVHDHLEKLGVRFTGLRYSYLDEKVEKFSLAQTHSELTQLHRSLTDTTQQAIETLRLLPDSNLQSAAQPEAAERLSI